MGSLLPVIFYFVTVGKNTWLQRFSLSTLGHTVWYSTIFYYVSHEITAFVSYQPITGSWEVVGSQVKTCSVNSQNRQLGTSRAAQCSLWQNYKNISHNVHPHITTVRCTPFLLYLMQENIQENYLYSSFTRRFTALWFYDQSIFQSWITWRKLSSQGSDASQSPVIKIYKICFEVRVVSVVLNAFHWSGVAKEASSNKIVDCWCLASNSHGFGTTMCTIDSRVAVTSQLQKEIWLYRTKMSFTRIFGFLGIWEPWMAAAFWIEEYSANFSPWPPTATVYLLHIYF